MKRASIGILFVAFFLVTGSAQAHVHCGSVIRRDTTLHRDLAGCHGTGLVMGRDGVTLNLGGHKVTGGQGAQAAGIKDRGHDHVRIENGAVTGGLTGILLSDHADRARLTRLEVEGTDGVAVTHSFKERITHSSLNGLDVVYLLHAHRVRVTDSKMQGREDGSLVVYSSHNVFRDDRVSAPHHIADLEYSARNRITRIRGNSTDADGIAVRGSSGNLVSRNSLGTFLVGGTAIMVTGGSNRNTVRANRVAFEPIVVGAEINGRVSSNNRLIDNEVSQGFIETQRGAARNTLIAGNSVTDSPGDGIHAGSPTTTVTGNIALRNKGHGINAVTGVTDGGGNRAVGNGLSPQCVNVACTPP